MTSYNHVRPNVTLCKAIQSAGAGRDCLTISFLKSVEMMGFQSKYIMHSISSQRKIILVTCACMAGMNIATDFFFFNLKSIQGHSFVLLIEIILQAAIYAMMPRGKLEKLEPFPNKWIAVVLGLNALTVAFKLLFVHVLANAPTVGALTELPFAKGTIYEIRQIADGNVDVIANALYQCGLCLHSDAIPLNEPFITYIFVLISAMAGEFNQHILWLTFHVANLLSAVVLIKITQQIFPSVRFPWLLLVLYVSVFEINGATLLLFKDGFIAFLVLSLFYVNARYIFQKNSNKFAFEVLSVLLIVLLYNLRTGLLIGILCISILNCLFDLKNWHRHLRVLLIGIFAIGMLGNVDGFSNNLQKSLTRATDKVKHGTGKHLDTENLTYTTSPENSLFHKLRLNEVTTKNFIYAPLVKASLYFLLPLPVNKTSSLPDLFHKLSTLIYASMFTMLLVGIYKITTDRNREEWYLLAIFGIFVALLLGAGPMLVPRYRIMTSAFFLLIAMVGASRSSNRLVAMNIGVSIFTIAAIIVWYSDIYNWIQSQTI
jgi:hypothetical protein